MSDLPALTIVVAVKGAESNLNDIELRLRRDDFPSVQFCFVFAGKRPSQLSDNCEAIAMPREALVPELWREGILRAKAASIALTTAQCIPSRDWVSTLLTADLSKDVGIGGTIDLDSACRATQRAIYFLRYSNYAPPLERANVADIAADNAVYRKASILEHADLLRTGFWEPSFHRRFAKQHLLLKLDPALRVTYRGHESAGDFIRLRFAHGREYALSRGRSVSRLRQLGWIAVSPFIPAVILGRIMRRLWRRPNLLKSLPGAAPLLIMFALAWSLGETCGYFAALRHKIDRADI